MALPGSPGHRHRIEWLVQNNIPLGVVCLLVAMGGVGKSYLLLLLCLLVTRRQVENPETLDGQIGNLNFNATPPLLGGTVAAHDRAVFHHSRGR
jgi:AAA domain